MSRIDVSGSDYLIQYTCFIKGVSLISVIDTSAAHSFVSLDCVHRLNLEVSFMI